MPDVTEPPTPAPADTGPVTALITRRRSRVPVKGIAAAALVLALVLGLHHMMGRRTREADRQRLEKVDAQVESGYLQQAFAALDSVADRDSPAFHERQRKAELLIAAAMREPPRPAAAEPRPKRETQPGEAEMIQRHSNRILAELRQGRSVDEVALNLQLPKLYIEAILRSQPP